MPQQFDLIAHIKRQYEFSQNTFGPGKRTATVLAHLRKELEEVELRPGDLGEWADLILLAIDGATRQGYSAEQIAAALFMKLAINERRVWPDWQTVADGEVMERDRTL